MGAAIKAMGDTATILRNNAILWAGGCPLALLFLVALPLGLALIPVVGPLISTLVTPVFLVGILSMAYAGRDGDASLGDFATGVAENYPYYLIATFIVVVLVGTISFAFGLLIAFTTSAGSAGVEGLAPMQNMTLLVLMLGATVVLGLVFLAVQFYDVAIVAGNNGPVGGFMQSFTLLISAPLSVVGYTLLRLVIGTVFFLLPALVVGVLGAGLSTAALGAGGVGAAASLSVGILLAGLAYLLVFLPLGYVVMFTYHVAFYNRHHAAGTVGGGTDRGQARSNLARGVGRSN